MTVKNPNAAALGKLGGSKGGHARCKALSPERRTEIAKQAARARWDKDDLTELEREYLEDMEALAKQNGEEWF